jgi:hypothetical protein
MAPNDRPNGATTSRLPGKTRANHVSLTASGREQIATPTGTGRIDSGAVIYTLALPPPNIPIQAADSPAVSEGIGRQRRREGGAACIPREN